jgi:hypothetical protein
MLRVARWECRPSRFMVFINGTLHECTFCSCFALLTGYCFLLFVAFDLLFLSLALSSEDIHAQNQFLSPMVALLLRIQCVPWFKV